MGSGQFGSVTSGVWRKGGCDKQVAIKSLKKEEDADKIKLLQEAVIMVQFQHPNVLYLHGAARQGDTVSKNVK